MAQLDHLDESTTNRLGILARKGWLSRQPEEFRTLIAGLGRWREVTAGQTLYLSDDEADWIVGQASGILEITFPLVGDEPVVIHRAEPGFWTGEASVIPGNRRIISLAAVTDARLLVIPAPALRRALEAEPRHWRSLYDLSLTNTTIAVTLVAEALSLSPRARVARILLRLAKADGSVEGSQEDLARLLGMTRSSIRRALSSLMEVGAVQSGYGNLSIRDRATLERLSSEP